jgi:hypothetical protein
MKGLTREKKQIFSLTLHIKYSLQYSEKNGNIKMKKNK